MTTYYAYNGSTAYRGTAATIGYAFTGVPGGMPTLPGSQYAQFSINNSVVAFPRVNYQINNYSNGSNVLRFRKGAFDTGSINIGNPNNINSLLKNIGSRLNLVGVGLDEGLGETLKEEGKKGNKKSVEEIVNLILNYGVKAVEIAVSLGLIKNKNSLTGAGGIDDGWGGVDYSGLDEIPDGGLPDKKEIGEKGGTIFGIKTEYVLLGTGGALLAYAFLKK